mmetsp:Transcript_8512/g.10768  ORF Transcript_8512/g.10768 Transcript_8512/m.10768 type:complete len:254 (-) Transcript_8512:2387-3148(-)
MAPFKPAMSNTIDNVNDCVQNDSTLDAVIEKQEENADSTRNGRSAKLRRRSTRSQSAPVSVNRKRRQKHRFVEQHFNLDKTNKALLPGVPVHDDDLARDIHDFFNLIFLVPIVVLNALNWNWDQLIYGNNKQELPFVHAWTGDYFDMFYWTTVAYFAIDLIWVCVIPKCVKSSSTIIQHHFAVLLYIVIPYKIHEYRFLMGICMSVELNTWFLIARRVFNKQGFPPWKIDLPCLVSVRVKLISIFFLHIVDYH